MKKVVTVDNLRGTEDFGRNWLLKSDPAPSSLLWGFRYGKSDVD